MISGFGPFAGRPVNASAVLARVIAKRRTEWEARAVEIPVIWGKPEEVIHEISQAPWDVWLAFGEGGPSTLRVETRADNARGGGRDIEQHTPPQPLIKTGAPAQLLWQRDGKALAEKITALGFSTRASEEAGGYLCEEMLFQLLLAREETAGRAVIFVHVPPLGQPMKTAAGPDAPVVPFDEQAMERFADLAAPELLRFLQQPVKAP